MDLEKTMRALERRGFHVSYFDTGAEAADAVSSQLSGKSIGIGGSMTADALGLYDTLSLNNDVYWHWRDPNAREKAASAQVYISSANAIAQTGEIVNIDGVGNRISALLYGHERVIILAGINKITEDLESAVYRARNVAAPLNARRHGQKTPCAVNEPMRCYDCGSQICPCRGMSIMMYSMGGIGRTDVILIGEELGY